MSMTPIRQIMLFLLLLMRASAQDTEIPKPLCHSELQPIQLSNSPLSVKTVTYEAYDTHSYYSALFENRGPKRIVEALVFVEYRRVDKAHISTAIFYGRSATSTVSLHLPNVNLRPVLNTWDNPIPAHATFSLIASSDITTSSCSAQASVSKIQLRFDDGSLYEGSTSNWGADPMIVEAPSADLSSFPLMPPTQFRAVITFGIQDEALVSNVYGTNANDSIKLWLQHVLSSWSIMPGEFGNEPNSYSKRLNLVFRIHSKGSVIHKWNQLGNDQLPIRIVDVYPIENHPAAVYVGGGFASKYALSAPSKLKIE